MFYACVLSHCYTSRIILRERWCGLRVRVSSRGGGHTHSHTSHAHTSLTIIHARVPTGATATHSTPPPPTTSTTAATAAATATAAPEKPKPEVTYEWNWSTCTAKIVTERPPVQLPPKKAYARSTPRAVIRWHLAYTLVNNPSLRLHRKRYLASLEDRSRRQWRVDPSVLMLR